MKKRLYLSVCGTIVLGLFLVGCGGSGSNTPTSSGNKLGVTAIPNTKATGKPGFARNFIEKGISILFNQNIANAAGDICGSPSSPIVADIPGGSIEIDTAIVILDGVEADLVGIAANEIELGPFALDLLDNDVDAGETIALDLPPGNYDGLKTDFKRIDDGLVATNTNITSLQGRLLDPGTERRPSVWIKGFLSDGTNASSCKAFTLATDHRWKVRIPFSTTLTSSDSVNLVVEFNLVKALDTALKNAVKDVTDLMAELGKAKIGIVDPKKQNIMGPEFLDGRTKDSNNHGTILALAWTNQIPANMKVYSQLVPIADVPTDDGTSLLDDTATPISGTPTDEGEVPEV